MSKMDGGPAFPVKDSGEFYSGASLRDVFAWQALPIVSDDEHGTVADAARELGISPSDYVGRVHWPMLCARRAYAWADAMLAERAKEQQP